MTKFIRNFIHLFELRALANVDEKEKIVKYVVIIVERGGKCSSVLDNIIAYSNFHESRE